MAGRPQGLGGLQRRPAASIVGQQDHLAVLRTGLLQQLHTAGDGQVRAAALNRHDLGRQGVDHAEDGLGVVGQRRHRKGIASKGHQAHLTVTAAAQDVRELVAGALEPGWGQVVGEHGTRQVQRHHPCRIAAEGRHRLALEGGIGQREHRDQPARGQQRQRPPMPRAMLGRRR
jgi:hypothetical protein